MSKVNGARELSDFFHELEKNIQDGVSEIIEGALQDIEMEAIRNAPGGGDRIQTQGGSATQETIRRGRSWVPISQAITYRMETPYKGSVIVDRSAGELAAWVEFGTGQSAKVYLATVPPEWRSYAQLFYINGRGTIVAQPYLLPAFNKYRIQAVKDLTDFLKQVVK